MSEGFTLMVVGMSVVFVALSLLLGVITLINRLLNRPAVPPASVPEPAVETREQVVEEEEEIDGQLIAILTAAATAVLGAKARVYRVRFVGDGADRGLGWVQQGRSSHHGSHRMQTY